MATEQNQIAAYASAVRAQLADLPPAEAEALLEDLEDHLAEVAAESGAPLEERLGSPAAYAAELRTAYRREPGPAAARPGAWGRVAGPLLNRARGLRSYQAVRGFLPELRPAWWVLRAYLAILVLAAVFSHSGDVQPIPNPISSRGLLQIILTIVAIVVSVRLGRREPLRSAWLRRAAVLANVLIAVAALFALHSMGTRYVYVQYGTPEASQLYMGPVGAYGMGPVTNIYPYSGDGKPLDHVLLYDQDGHPLTVVGGKGYRGINTDYPLAADGQPITNQYPLDQHNPDGSAVAPPRVPLPPIRATASPSPSPRPSLSPTPTPTG